jgi:hypothetical protein
MDSNSPHDKRCRSGPDLHQELGSRGQIVHEFHHFLHCADRSAGQRWALSAFSAVKSDTVLVKIGVVRRAAEVP